MYWKFVFNSHYNIVHILKFDRLIIRLSSIFLFVFIITSFIVQCSLLTINADHSHQSLTSLEAPPFSVVIPRSNKKNQSIFLNSSPATNFKIQHSRCSFESILDQYSEEESKFFFLKI